MAEKTPADRTLGEFGVPEVEPPQVVRKRVRWSPTKKDKPAGFIGRITNRDSEGMVHKCYTSRRGGYHYYQKGDGYAISDSILRVCKSVGVSTVLLWHKDTGNVWEFPAADYYNGTSVPEADLEFERDPQTYVSLDNAHHKWESHAEQMFKRNFEQAMSACTTR